MRSAETGCGLDDIARLHLFIQTLDLDLDLDLDAGLES